MSESARATDAGPFLPDAVAPVEDSDGILRARTGVGELSAAQRVNLAAATARAYEPLWRRWSIAILTLGEWTTPRELDLMTAWVEPGAGERLLDAGCSAGLYARTLLAREPAATVHAVDVSLPFLREAQRRARDLGASPVLLQANVERLPYRDGAFDAVVCGGSLNEFRDAAGALRELSRVLKPGGRAFLMYPCRARTPLGRWLQRVLEPSGLSFPARADVDGWARDAGLVAVRDELHRPVQVTLYRRADAATGADADSG